MASCKVGEMKSWQGAKLASRIVGEPFPVRPPPPLQLPRPPVRGKRLAPLRLVEPRAHAESQFNSIQFFISIHAEQYNFILIVKVCRRQIRFQTSLV